MEIDIILEPDLKPNEIRELGILAENYGFRALWTECYVRARDPFMTLVPLAEATDRIKLGVMVVGPWEQHPIKTLNTLLTLNEYSHGRACLVVSAGAEWCGVIGQEPERRVRAAREMVEILIGASTNDVLNYEGELYKVRRGFNASWATDERPLIYVGAGKKQMIRMSTRVADGFMMSDMPLQLIDEAIGYARDALAAGNRSSDDFRISNFWAWHIKENREEAFREARREMMLRAWLDPEVFAAFLSPEDLQIMIDKTPAFLKAYRDRSGNIEDVPESIVNQMIENITATGDMSDLDRQIDRLRQFRDAGLTEIGLRAHDDPASTIRTIGERVLPALQ